LSVDRETSKIILLRFLFFSLLPNNHKMISFLRHQGYTVINLIEIRKPFKEEVLTQKINVGEHIFDY